MKKLKIIASAAARAHESFSKAFAMAVYALQKQKKLVLDFKPAAEDTVTGEVTLPENDGTVAVVFERPEGLSMLCDSKQALIRESAGVEKSYTPSRYASPETLEFVGTVAGAKPETYFTLTEITGRIVFNWFEGEGDSLEYKRIEVFAADEVEYTNLTEGGERSVADTYMAIDGDTIYRHAYHLAPPTMEFVTVSIDGTPTQLEEWTFTVVDDPRIVYSYDGGHTLVTVSALGGGTWSPGGTIELVWQGAEFVVRGTKSRGYEITKVAIRSAVHDMAQYAGPNTHVQNVFLGKPRWIGGAFQVAVSSCGSYRDAFGDDISSMGVVDVAFAPRVALTATSFSHTYPNALGSLESDAYNAGFVSTLGNAIVAEWGAEDVEQAYVYAVRWERQSRTESPPEGPAITTGPHYIGWNNVALYLFRRGAITQISPFLGTVNGANLPLGNYMRPNGTAVVTCIGNNGADIGVRVYDEAAGSATFLALTDIPGAPSGAYDARPMITSLQGYQFSLTQFWHKFHEPAPTHRVVGEVGGKLVVLAGVANVDYQTIYAMLGLYVDGVLIDYRARTTVNVTTVTVPRTHINVSTYEDADHKLIFCHLPTGSSWRAPTMTIWGLTDDGVVKMYETGASEGDTTLAYWLQPFVFNNFNDDDWTSTSMGRITVRLLEELEVTVGAAEGKYKLKVLQWECCTARYFIKQMMCIGFDASGNFVPELTAPLNGYSLPEWVGDSAYFHSLAPVGKKSTVVATPPA